ncbi:MAG: RNA polymerase sigma factor [Flavobacteriaceae bacterium]|nr:RNA polymerase sigma factor [Bacteroidia bacterium]NNF75225.1 RNA polymerase sigma factor [Flavobacteriaceae bacterium]NNK73847.1 RNA polymerase sigma factor [Flavobacteriaceae bacterium]
MSLELLIENCKQNDTKAQSELYKMFSRKMFALCLKYSRNRAEAEDVLQDSFITIFKKIEQYNFKGSFEGWLKRITINTALQRYRGQGVLNIVDEGQIEDLVIEAETEDLSIDFLLNCIQELPDRYRLVFNLYALDGYSHKEIANMLEISTGTTKSNLARARMILKNKIETYKSQVNLQSL